MAIWGLLHLYMNSTINLPISAKKATGVSIDRDFVESVEQFEDYHHLNNIKSSNPRTWDVFSFI